MKNYKTVTVQAIEEKTKIILENNMELNLINEKLIGQSVKLTSEVSQETFNTILNANDCNDVVLIDFKLGNSHYFKNQTINKYLTDFGCGIILTCKTKSLNAIFDRTTITPKIEMETKIYPRLVFNAKYFRVETKITCSISTEQGE